MDVLALLRSKNKCLQKYLDLSLAFLDEAAETEFAGLSEFEHQRDATLKAIELFDRKLSEAVALLPQSERSPKLIESVKMALEAKEVLIHQILAVDLKIISKIEEQRTLIMKELAANQKSKDSISRFKSSWLNESGSEIDKKV